VASADRATVGTVPSVPSPGVRRMGWNIDRIAREHPAGV